MQLARESSFSEESASLGKAIQRSPARDRDKAERLQAVAEKNRRAQARFRSKQKLRMADFEKQVAELSVQQTSLLEEQHGLRYRNNLLQTVRTSKAYLHPRGPDKQSVVVCKILIGSRRHMMQGPTTLRPPLHVAGLPLCWLASACEG